MILPSNQGHLVDMFYHNSIGLQKGVVTVKYMAGPRTGTIELQDAKSTAALQGVD
jgi:hypothetical protein